MNKSGYIYTAVTIILILIITTTILFYSSVQKTETEVSISTMTCDELHLYVKNIKSEFANQVKVGGRIAIQEIVIRMHDTGNATNNATGAIEAMLLNGNYSELNAIMPPKYSFLSWATAVQNEGSKKGYNFMVTFGRIDIAQINATTLGILARMNLYARDWRGTCFYNNTDITVFETVSLLSAGANNVMYDPIFAVNNISKEFVMCGNQDVHGGNRLGVGDGGKGIYGEIAITAKYLKDNKPLCPIVNSSTEGEIECDKCGNITLPATDALIVACTRSEMTEVGTAQRFSCDRDANGNIINVTIKDIKGLILYFSYSSGDNFINLTQMNSWSCISSKNMSLIINGGNMRTIINESENSNPSFPSKFFNNTNYVDQYSSGDIPSTGDFIWLVTDNQTLNYTVINGSDYALNFDCFYISNTSMYGCAALSSQGDGPSFLDRMENVTNLSERYKNLSIWLASEIGTAPQPIGIESYVNPETFNFTLSDYGNYSVADYLYFQNFNSTCRCYGTPYRLLYLDCQHRNKTGIDDLCTCA